MFIWEQLEKAQIHYKRFKMLDIIEVKNFKILYSDFKNSTVSQVSLTKMCIRDSSQSMQQKVVKDYYKYSLKQMQKKETLLKGIQ